MGKKGKIIIIAVILIGITILSVYLVNILNLETRSSATNDEYSLYFPVVLGTQAGEGGSKIIIRNNSTSESDIQVFFRSESDFYNIEQTISGNGLFILDSLDYLSNSFSSVEVLSTQDISGVIYHQYLFGELCSNASVSAYTSDDFADIVSVPLLMHDAYNSTYYSHLYIQNVGEGVVDPEIIFYDNNDGQKLCSLTLGELDSKESMNLNFRDEFPCADKTSNIFNVKIKTSGLIVAESHIYEYDRPVFSAYKCTKGTNSISFPDQFNSAYGSWNSSITIGADSQADASFEVNIYNDSDNDKFPDQAVTNTINLTGKEMYSKYLPDMSFVSTNIVYDLSDNWIGNSFVNSKESSLIGISNISSESTMGFRSYSGISINESSNTVTLPFIVKSYEIGSEKISSSFTVQNLGNVDTRIKLFFYNEEGSVVSAHCEDWDNNNFLEAHRSKRCYLGDDTNSNLQEDLIYSVVISSTESKINVLSNTVSIDGGVQLAGDWETSYQGTPLDDSVSFANSGDLWIHVPHGYFQPDYMDLFSSSDLWNNKIKNFSTIGFFAGHLHPDYSYGTEPSDQELKAIVSKINEWDRDIDIEMGVLKNSWGGCENLDPEEASKVTADIVIDSIDRIVAAGGTVTSIRMDEPLLGIKAVGSYGDNGCGYTVEQVNEGVISYMKLINKTYPDIVFHEFEPWPALSTEELLMRIPLLKENDIKSLILDIHYPDILTRNAKLSDLQLIKKVCEENNVKLGIVFAGGYTSLYSSEKVSLYEESVLAMADIIHSIISPDYVILETWDFQPATTLEGEYSFVNTCLHYLEAYPPTIIKEISNSDYEFITINNNSFNQKVGLNLFSFNGDSSILPDYINSSFLSIYNKDFCWSDYIGKSGNVLNSYDFESVNNALFNININSLDGSSSDSSPLIENDINDFIDFVGSQVSLINSIGKGEELNYYWKLLSNPDIISTNIYSLADCWGESSDLYFELLKLFYSEVKLLSSNNMVVLGNVNLCNELGVNCVNDGELNINSQFLNELFSNDNIEDYFDYISFDYNLHSENDVWLNYGGGVLGKVRYVKSLMQKQSFQKPIIVNLMLGLDSDVIEYEKLLKYIHINIARSFSDSQVYRVILPFDDISNSNNYEKDYLFLNNFYSDNLVISPLYLVEEGLFPEKEGYRIDGHKQIWWSNSGELQSQEIIAQKIYLYNDFGREIQIIRDGSDKDLDGKENGQIRISFQDIPVYVEILEESLRLEGTVGFQYGAEHSDGTFIDVRVYNGSDWVDVMPWFHKDYNNQLVTFIANLEPYFESGVSNEIVIGVDNYDGNIGEDWIIWTEAVVKKDDWSYDLIENADEGNWHTSTGVCDFTKQNCSGTAGAVKYLYDTQAEDYNYYDRVLFTHPDWVDYDKGFMHVGFNIFYND